LTTHFDNSTAFLTLNIISAMLNAFIVFLMMWVKEL